MINHGIPLIILAHIQFIIWYTINNTINGGITHKWIDKSYTIVIDK